MKQRTFALVLLLLCIAFPISLGAAKVEVEGKAWLDLQKDPPEINVNGKTGFLSSVGDIASMAKNSITILENDETLRKFKANAAAHAKLFDIHRIVPQYEALYNRFCQCL